MWRCLLVNFLLSAAVAAPCVAQQGRDYTTEAGVDSDGHIYVVSDAGKRTDAALRGVRNQRRLCSRCCWKSISGNK